MGDVSVKTNVTTEGRSILDVAKENAAVDDLKSTTIKLKEAINVTDRFINNPDDTSFDERSRLVLSTWWWDDPFINCSTGGVYDSLDSRENLSLHVKNAPRSEIVGWNQYNAEIARVEGLRLELVDKLKVVCGAVLFVRGRDHEETGSLSAIVKLLSGVSGGARVYEEQEAPLP